MLFPPLHYSQICKRIINTLRYFIVRIPVNIHPAKLTLLKFHSLFVLFTLVLTLPVKSQTVVLQDGVNSVSTGKNIYYFIDRNHEYNINDIVNKKIPFKHSELNTPNLGITSATIWCYFDVFNRSEGEWILNFAYPCTDTVIAWQTEDGRIREFQNGWFYPLQSRAVLTNDLNYSIPFTKGKTTRIYMKIRGNVILIPLTLERRQVLEHKFRVNSGYFIFYLGVVAMLFFYNLAVFFTSKQWEYLFYSIWVLCSVVFFANLKGYASLVLPLEFNLWFRHVNILAAAAGVFILLFVEFTLRLRENWPAVIKWFRILMLINIIVVGFSAFELFTIAYNLVMFNLIITVIFGLLTGIRVYKKGMKFARYYMVGFGVTLISMLMFICIYLHLIEWNDFTSNAILIGNSIEMLLFSMGLGDKIKFITDEKQKAQEFAIGTLKEKEQFISEQNIVLARKVQERTAELSNEKEKSDKLLMNILPEEVAEELKQTGTAAARQFQNVTVIFTDFVNFTRISEKMSPAELVAEINHYFTAFDNIIEKHGLEKIKTIGDAYMAVSGLPVPFPDHAIRAANAAIEIRDWVMNNSRRFNIRIGLHSGDVIAGIVGIKKYAYDIWGDTVNTAARMEQNSEPNKINVSGSTFELLKDYFEMEYRGKIMAKNKGEIDMYFIT